MLLYATCSVFPEENEQILEAFLGQHGDALEHAIDARWGIVRTVGRQIVPGEEGMDGFFYARLTKR
jgi:16S rRNA (cytosine967-C5)-methyltransferase